MVQKFLGRNASIEFLFLLICQSKQINMFENNFLKMYQLLVSEPYNCFAQ